MDKQWEFKNVDFKEEARLLSSAINVNPVIATILCQRGIYNFEDAFRFFRPQLSHLHDPFLMKDMDRAVHRIVDAIYIEQKILFFGDYDVDGTTSVALMYSVFKEFYSHIGFYIPDRYKEGYGISKLGIDFAKAEGYQLIVSLDCGIKSIELVSYAASLGIDFIICDHHTPGEFLPEAVAVLDPKRLDCAYPYKELSGCGVGFKLCQALYLEQGWDLESLYPHLDLVAVSIAADIVPITGENRTLAYFGLKIINQMPRTGIAALFQVAQFKKPFTISDLVFAIGPRINAAGRIAHAKAAVELLLAEDEEEALRFARSINQKNTDRKNVDKSITTEALNMIAENSSYMSAKSTVLFKEDWHKGVIGIVASRCIEKYYKPTIIFTASDNKATGSARSVQGYDIYEAISSCADLLEQFGGHAFAAGLTLPIDKVSQFRDRFEEVVRATISPELLTPSLEIDLKLDISLINPKFYSILQQMSPFGPGNMQPVFVSENLHCIGQPSILKEEHLKMTVGCKRTGEKLPAIGFGMAHFKTIVQDGKTFDMAYSIQMNRFRDQATLQLEIKDIKSTKV